MEDNDIEILEVVKESMGEEMSTELNGGTFFSGVNVDEKHMGENDSGNNDISDMSLREIDNEWYHLSPMTNKVITKLENWLTKVILKFKQRITLLKYMKPKDFNVQIVKNVSRKNII